MNIREHLKAINNKVEFKVAVMLTIIGFFVTNVVTFLTLRVHDLEATVAAEQGAHENVLEQKEVEIKSILPPTFDAPLLTYPDNNASLLGQYVRLEWREGKDQSPARAYTLELIKAASAGATETSATVPSRIQATDPEHTSSTLRLVKPYAGSYYWRVRRGGPDEHDTAWSSYFRFEIFESSLQRIRQNKELLIGTFLPTSVEVLACPSNSSPRDITGQKADDIVLNQVCEEVAGNLGFTQIRFRRFSSPDALVYQGVKDGNVDLAVSGLSPTDGRRRRGVLFSDPYLKSHLVVARWRHEKAALSDFARVGVIRGGTNAQFARELQRHKLITIVEAGSIDELLRLLEEKAINVIIIDEPLIDAQVNGSHDLEVVEHLSTGLGGLTNFFELGSVVSDARAGMAVAVHEDALRYVINQILTLKLRDRIRSAAQVR